MIVSQGFLKSKPISTKKSNPCPVCGDSNGKCRIFDNKPLVLCMGADSAPNWKNLGFDRSGLWTKFIPDNGSQFDRDEWQRRKREKPPATLTMDVEDRDYWYRKIVFSLTLNDLDRQYLKDVRGMSDREIDLFGARSYSPNQALTIRVPREVPGVITRQDGSQFLPAVASGIYFPIPNERGQWRGMSFRFTNPVNGRRYGNCSNRHNPYNVGTVEGEQPIAVHFPIDQEPTGIAFTEGTGFKPFLAAQRTGKIVIGCPGGNFGGSAIQIKQALEYLCRGLSGDWYSPSKTESRKRSELANTTATQTGTHPLSTAINTPTQSLGKISQSSTQHGQASKTNTQNGKPNSNKLEESGFSEKGCSDLTNTAILYPDAGSPTNRAIVAQYRRLNELCGKLSYTLQIAWWGQRTKQENDVDEATQAEIDSAELLTWQEFQALSEFKPETQNQPEQSDRKSVTLTDCSIRAEQNQPEQSDRDRLIAKRVLRFRQFWQDLQRDFLLPSIVNGNEIRRTTYTGFAPEFDLFSDTTCIQGWLGAGKTETILRSLIPFKDMAIVWVSPRNGLLRQTAQRAKRLGFEAYHYQDDPGKFRSMLEAGEPGIYFMAPDSFKPYAVGKVEWENVILVIDEFSGIRKEILGKSTELPQFTTAIARCASLIVADAFLSQIDIRVIQKYRSGSMQILKQDFKKSSVRIKWLECRNKEGDISFNHIGIYYALLDRWIDEGIGRIAIAVDNLLIAKMLDRYLKSKGIRTWIVCSETPQENQAFMSEPDNVIRDGKIQAAIYTPTAQSGLDIQAKFDRGLLIATGTLSPLQMVQMLGRCRQCLEWLVSAPRHSGNPDCATPSLDGNKIRQWSEQITQTFSDLDFNAPSEMQAWSIWEELTRHIEKAFTSEYLRCLLDYFFESVETIEVESDRVSEWRKDAQILKSEDAEKTLKGDLQNGLRLSDEQKQPKLNSEVWDVKLAEFWSKHPKVANKTIADIGVEELAPNAIELTKLFQSRRVEKLKNYVIATEPNEQDDRDLLQYLQERPTHYNAGNFKRLQFIKLFRSLNLGKLATVTSPKETEADVNAFRVDSSAITKLYRQFQANSELSRLFPIVDSQKAFFAIVKACLSYLGYERGGKSIRVETESLNQNGRDRNGNQRFSKSRAIYFVFWFAMEFSGSAYFRENLELILQSIRDRLKCERDDRQKRREQKERYESPPPGWEAYAA